MSRELVVFELSEVAERRVAVPPDEGVLVRAHPEVEEDHGRVGKEEERVAQKVDGLSGVAILNGAAIKERES